MERQLKSDIEVEVKFSGVPLEVLPDFTFTFYSELNSSTTYECSKQGSELTNCVISERDGSSMVKCMLENHGLKPGRLCVSVHIKWNDPDYKDGVRDDVYRKKLPLIIKP